jgi:uncharacterized Zn-finger protein
MWHIPRVYTRGRKPYKCNECPAEFTLKGHLNTHMRIHTGVKPYKCSECPAEFTRIHHLSSHLRTHTGEKPYNVINAQRSFHIQPPLPLIYAPTPVKSLTTAMNVPHHLLIQGASQNISNHFTPPKVRHARRKRRENCQGVGKCRIWF